MILACCFRLIHKINLMWVCGVGVGVRNTNQKGNLTREFNGVG